MTSPPFFVRNRNNNFPPDPGFVEARSAATRPRPSRPRPTTSAPTRYPSAEQSVPAQSTRLMAAPAQASTVGAAAPPLPPLDTRPPPRPPGGMPMRSAHSPVHPASVPQSPGSFRSNMPQPRSPTYMLQRPLTACSQAHASLSRQLSQLTAPPVFDPDLKELQAMEDRLPFWQRHFTEPVDPDPDRTYDPKNRRFATTALGSILAAVALLVVLVAAVAAAVAVTLDHKHETARRAAQADGGSFITMAIYDNFPDPSIWYVDDTWYAYATNDGAGILQAPTNASKVNHGLNNVQLATSEDFVNWTVVGHAGDPLPQVGAWADQHKAKGDFPVPFANTWAPGVIQRQTDQKYVMYYSAAITKETEQRHNGSLLDVIQDEQDPNGPVRIVYDVPGRDKPGNPRPIPHCVGAAVAETPTGPFSPLDDALACPVQKGGAIDPAPFIDKDGEFYVTYKVDGNSLGLGGQCGNTVKPIVPTPIMLQRMQADGTTPIDDPIQILDRIESDGPLVEAPFIVRSHEGHYFLFFSSGCTRDPTYDVKYAVADHVAGPYTRADTPLLKTAMIGDTDLLAPGSVSVHPDQRGGWNIAFHARVPTDYGRVRAMFTSKLKFEKDTVKLVSSGSGG